MCRGVVFTTACPCSGRSHVCWQCRDNANGNETTLPGVRTAAICPNLPPACKAGGSRSDRGRDPHGPSGAFNGEGPTDRQTGREVGGDRPSPQGRAAKTECTFCNHQGNNRCPFRTQEGPGGAGAGAQHGAGPAREGQRQSANGSRLTSRSHSIIEMNLT